MLSGIPTLFGIGAIHNVGTCGTILVIVGAPLAGAADVVFCHTIPVSVAVATNGPDIGHISSVRNSIVVAGGVAAVGGDRGGKIELGVFYDEPVVGGYELGISGDKNCVVRDDLVEDGLLFGGYISQVVHLPIKFFEKAGWFTRQIVVSRGGGCAKWRRWRCQIDWSWGRQASCACMIRWRRGSVASTPHRPSR